jgi:predicted RecB family endonuclease
MPWPKKPLLLLRFLIQINSPKSWVFFLAVCNAMARKTTFATAVSDSDGWSQKLGVYFALCNTMAKITTFATAVSDSDRQSQKLGFLFLAVCNAMAKKTTFATAISDSDRRSQKLEQKNRPRFPVDSNRRSPQKEDIRHDKVAASSQ